MSDHINHLVICRKRTSLTQGDMAYLMGFTEQSKVSRSEKGEKIPSLEMILIYSIVLNVSVKQLFHGYRLVLLKNTKEKMTSLIEELSNQKSSKRIRKRILYLTKVLEEVNKEIDKTPSNSSKSFDKPEMSEPCSGMMNFF
jgi:transcriptional regulator with XRE-family HTH domain